MSNRPQSGRGKRNDRDLIYKEDRQDLRSRDVRPVDGKTLDGSPSRGGKGRGGLRRDRDEPRGSRKEDDLFRGKKYDTNKNGPGKAYAGRGYDASNSREYVSSERRHIDHRGFGDDSRFSRLVKRITREDDREKRISNLMQLKELMAYPENSKVLSKMCESLYLTLQDIFYERTYKDVKREAAVCLGTAGAYSGSNLHRFIEWIFTQMSAANQEEPKVLLLEALLETLQQDLSKKMVDYAPSIMGQCQLLLESVDTPQLLMSVVNVILQLAQLNPQCLANHFRDTVDILVGWHIDCSQHDEVTTFTSSALVSLHDFWVTDMGFSLTLMGQFLEDMEAYAEDLGLGVNGQGAGSDEDMPGPQECISKIAALLRVFITVILSLQDYFTGSRGPPLTSKFISQALDRIVKCVKGAVECISHEPVLTAANCCIAHMVTALGSEFSPHTEEVLGLILWQLKQSSVLCSQAHMLSLLQVICKVIDQVTTQLPVDFLSNLLSPKSCVHQMVFVRNEQVLSELIKLYHTIMRLKSVPLLQNAYRFVLGDLEVAMNTLFAAQTPSPSLSFVADNPFLRVEYSVVEAELVAMFNVNALSEIGNAKSNVIAMWALSPSFFELHTCHLLLPENSARLHRFPVLHYTLWKAFYSHCSRHGHFVSSSQLIKEAAKTENGGSNMLTNVNSSTSGHFASIVSLLANIFTCVETPFDTELVSFTWCQEIIEALQTNSHVYATAEFSSMIHSLIPLGHDTHAIVSSSVCDCLKSYISSVEAHSPSALRKIVELCCYKLSSPEADLRAAYMDLLKMVPSNMTVSFLEGIMSRRSHVMRWNLGKLRHQHMMSAPLGTFHSHNFKSIMLTVLGMQPFKVEDNQWLQRMYFSCQRSNPKNGRSGPQTADLGDTVSGLWFWAAWEAAQFCIMSKLRTPLGKPQETFTAIEAAVKKLAIELRKSEEESTFGGCPEVMVRVQILLEFMTCLEKLLYNAFEGTAQTIVTPPKVVRIFFRTNRVTCQEWLVRLRPTLARIAFHSGHVGSAVRHAMTSLRELSESGRSHELEFEEMMILSAQAACQLKCPEAIQGLQAWHRKNSHSKLPWAKACALMAAGKYESALLEFKSIVRHSSSTESSLEEPLAQMSLNSNPATPLGSPSIESKDLAPDGASCPNPAVLTFSIKQVWQCYAELRDWTEAVKWHENLQQWKNEAGDNSVMQAFNYAHMDINVLKALASFDGQAFDKTSELLELIPGASVDSGTQPSPHLEWSPLSVAEAVGKRFLGAIVLTQLDSVQAPGMMNYQCRKEVTEILAECQKSCEAMLRAGCLQWPQNLHTHLLLALLSASSAANVVAEADSKTWLPSWCSALALDSEMDRVGPPVHILALTQLQQLLAATLPTQMQPPPDFQSAISSLHLHTSTLARKQSNFNLAQSLLVKEMYHCLGRPCPETTESLLDVMSELTNSPTAPPMSGHLLKIERNGAKLLKSMGQSADAIEVLAGSTCRFLDQDATGSFSMPKALRSVCCDLNARSLVSLVQWLQVDYKNLGRVVGQMKTDEENGLATTVRKLLFWENEMTRNLSEDGTFDKNAWLEQGEASGNGVLSEADSIVKRLFHLATLQSPNLPKAWLALASFCYKWGRKAVDNAIHGDMKLTAEETDEVMRILPKGTSESDASAVLKILCQIHSRGSEEEDISEQDQSLCDEGAEATRRQLLSTCLSLQVAPDSCIDRLIEIWEKGVGRVYQHYRFSAQAYFTYLKLEGQTGCEDGHVTATLRLLRLLVKHAWEVRSVLETGLATTPTAPWRGIIPQLFSRLSHPEPYVRQSVSELLCRVAHEAPHLVVYPAVIGSSSAPAETNRRAQINTGLLNQYLSQDEDRGDSQKSEVAPEVGKEAVPDLQVDDKDEDEDEEEEDEEKKKKEALLQNCFSAIVDTLSTANPRLVSEIQMMVGELRRITLLWDELWLGTLNQHQADVTRRLQQLEHEVKKVNSIAGLDAQQKSAIIREKHNTVLKPTVYAMERLQAITSVTPETPHERWFQETYSSLISQALKKLKQPRNPSHPYASWNLFKQLHASLQQRAQKRSSLVLEMSQLSSKLSALTHTVIAMPGINAQNQVVTVEAIHNTVQILPTKTKPKKLQFLGSDGKKYQYLFKGLEDLHLDERIMQFLSIVNNMFAKDNRGEHAVYRARHYSVTPLGARSGLIQWVEGATPLFSLYKRWQQREALAAQAKVGQVPSAAAPITIPRPSDVYFGALTPALKEAGITSAESRKDWPFKVMRNVLEQLMRETPSDLLARELWWSSPSCLEWWNITQTYARSTAVMSMIGYIIGLGDRHLDNVLVDLATGEVVHIDYNVCFEKGKSLRVPEKVPFRMTPNIQTALGVSGVEGLFRLASEHVIRTLRKGRETLLTLLEAFVYDPLVDWTTGSEGGYTGAFYGGGLGSALAQNIPSKRQMEQEITLSMFAIRVAEMKPAWLGNKEEMLLVLPRLLSTAQSLLQKASELHSVQAQLVSVSAQQEYLEAASDDPSHSLHTLLARHGEYEVIQKSRQEVEKMIADKLHECAQWKDNHKRALQALRSGHLQKIYSDLNQSGPLAGITCFAPVVEFLQGAGQSQLVTQYEQVRVELGSVVHQRCTVAISCLDVLTNYAAVVAFLPASYVTLDRTSKWQQMLQDLVCDFTSSKCDSIIQEVQSIYGSTPNPQSQAAVTMATQLQQAMSDCGSKLMKVADRRTLDATETATLELHVNEASHNIHHFITENGPPGALCMVTVVISALSALSKRYLVMEEAASSAADRLVDLMSREGDWFLDELCSMSGNINHLLSMLQHSSLVVNGMDTETNVQAIVATHAVYVALQDLNLNFRSIILPESLKSLQTAEPSMLAMLEALDSIIGATHLPLDTILSQLEGKLRNAILGMKAPEQCEVTSALINTMRCQFSQLVEAGSSNATPQDLSPGKMLLMGFTGLFTRLQDDFSAMLESVSRLQVPDLWRKIDVVKRARAIQMTAFNERTLDILSDIFFLKQIKTIVEFFSLCRDSVNALQEPGGEQFYDEEQLCRPVKMFIAEYIRKNVIGLPSQSLGYILCLYINALHVDVTAEIELRDIGAECKVVLEDLYKRAVDACLKNGSFPSALFTNATALIGSADNTWRKLDLARRLDTTFGLMQGSLQRLQMQYTCFHWMHESSLLASQNALPNLPLSTTRASIVADLSKRLQMLQSQETAMTAAIEKHLTLEVSISQRLKWAAGANPSLNQVAVQFEEILSANKALLQSQGDLCSEVASLCAAVLHLETLYSSSAETVEADRAFLALIARCQEVCQVQEACTTTVSDLELSLISSQPMLEDENLDEWLTRTRAVSIELLPQLETKIEQLNKELESSKDAMKSEVNSVRGILTTHHKLMSDIRSILKSLAKQEEQDSLSSDSCITEYMAAYKTFSENFTSLLRLLISEDLADEVNVRQEVEQLVTSLKDQIKLIYDDLIAFAPPLKSSNDCNESQEKVPNFANAVKRGEMSSDSAAPSPKRLPLALKSDTQLNSSSSQSKSFGVAKKSERVTRDPHTGKAIQERNSYAVGVWRRVKTKLDGRDPDANKRLQVAEQVDYVIQEATSLDNLCLLYEGWTPWV